ncbi:MAG: AraC family transcriptional regulator [Oscillospiraceae bacterium]|nr:AraC family transcriptional regulator [Oscillospiraceae bacterium]
MDWLDNMNAAIEYIETHLANEISYDRAAQIACCSTYHFQRMFSYITGVPLSEYIRRRRLTLAAFELQTGNCKVIDTAMKYGYESPEAFSRAFKKLHGVMPVSARDIGVSLKAYPKMTFHITIKGDVEMNYRIEQREAFEVFGVYGTVGSNMEKAFTDVSEFVTKELEKGTWDSFNDLLGRPHDTWYHAALFGHTDTTFKYMICYYTPPGLEIPENYTRLSVQAQTWAIFPAADGSNNKMHDIWRRIYSEWFPTSEYEQAEAPSFEMYYGYGRGDSGNGVSEIWIPIKKK